jgi:hypothetical protein
MAIGWGAGAQATCGAGAQQVLHVLKRLPNSGEGPHGAGQPQGSPYMSCAEAVEVDPATSSRASVAARRTEGENIGSFLREGIGEI